MAADGRSLICVAVPDGASVAPIRERLALHWAVTVATGIDHAHRALRRSTFQVGVVAIASAAAINPADVTALLHAYPSMQWIGIFPPGIAEADNWRELIVDALVDFHTHPVDLDRLALTVGHTYGMARLLEQMKTALPNEPGGAGGDIIGDSPAMTQLQRQVRKVARVDAPVLVSGESGSGKELTAHLLHHHSARRAGPFVPVNCGAIPATLIQSELFGYERGAFTGAGSAHQGLFESTAGGTLFLDEIADLSLDLQTNLLRFLQEKTMPVERWIDGVSAVIHRALKHETQG